MQAISAYMAWGSSAVWDWLGSLAYLQQHLLQCFQGRGSSYKLLSAGDGDAAGSTAGLWGKAAAPPPTPEPEVCVRARLHSSCRSGMRWWPSFGHGLLC